MKFKEPAGGWPLRLAVTELVREPFLQLAHAVTQLEALAVARGGSNTLEGERRDLWYDVQEQLRLGELVAHGRRPGMPTGERIPPDFFDSAQPDYKADMMIAPDLIYYGVRITKPIASSSAEAALATLGESGTKRKGGRPPIHDWEAFRKELVRGAFAGEFENKRHIREHMTNWCATNWPVQPDDRTLRDELSKLLHDKIPEN